VKLNQIDDQELMAGEAANIDPATTGPASHVQVASSAAQDSKYAYLLTQMANMQVQLTQLATKATAKGS